MLWMYLKYRFSNWRGIERVFALFTAIMFMIAFFVYTFQHANTTTMPVEYIDALKTRAEEISQNPEKLLEHDGKIIIKDGIVKYSFENTGYRADAEFDEKTFDIISISFDDKAMSVLSAIIVSAVVSMILGIVVYGVGLLFAAIVSGVVYLCTKNEYGD